MDSRLLWLALAAFVGAVEGGLIAGQLPLIGAEMGVTIGQAGLLVVGYSLAYAVGTPVLAVLLGGVGRRRVAAGSEFALAICAVLLAVAPFFEWMVVVRTALAVAAGTLTGTATLDRGDAGAGRSARALHAGDHDGPVARGAGRGAAWGVDRDAVFVAHQLRGDRGDGGRRGARDLSRAPTRHARGYAVDARPSAGLGQSRRAAGAPLDAAVHGGCDAGVDLCRGDDVARGGGHRGAAAGVFRGRDRGADDGAHGGKARRPDRQPGDSDRHGGCGDGDALRNGLTAAGAAGASLCRCCLLAFAIHAYTVWTFSIAVQSQLAHLAPSSVPVAISLNMSGFNIAMAIAAAAGGVIVDGWGASVLALAGVPLIVGALAIWVFLPRR